MYADRLSILCFISLRGIVPVALIVLSLACTSPDENTSIPATALGTTESSDSETISSTPTAVSGSSAPPGTRTLPDAGPVAPSGQRAYEHVKELAVDIGSRPTGTDTERHAADYISSQFKSYGYSVSLQEFRFPFFQDNGSNLELVSPVQEVLTAKTMHFSRGGEVEGSVTYGGLGRPEDLAAIDLEGKIALLERGQIAFQEKVAGASAKGAVAAIIYNNQDGDLMGSLQTVSPIPSVSITRDEGQRLRDMIPKGEVRLKLKVDSGPSEIHSQNVIAIPSVISPAQGNKPCNVIVGGHYDSVEAGPGANDNASGTAVVLELSRAARDLAFDAGVCFVAFGGEELGLWGSRRYVESLSSQDRAEIKGMINLDMIGVGDRWRVTGSESLVDLAVQAGKAEQIDVQAFTMPRMFGSDHSSFINVGIPGLFIHRLDDPNYHTPEDKAEFIVTDALGDAAEITLGVIEGLTGSGP